MARPHPKRRQRIRRPLLTRALLLALALLAPAAPAEELAVQPVAPGVFVHYGRMVDLDSPARGDSANAGFVVGEHCVAVIDTGGAVATGTALAAAVARRTDKPVCYVINTHVHFDHVLGNAAFANTGVRFVGHHALRAAMDANRDFFAEHFAEELGGADGQARVIGPDELVEDSLELDLGARVLALRAVPPAHTRTDLTVLDRVSGTLFAGDLVFRQRLPVLDGSLEGWLAWLGEAMQVDYARVVPGHGPVDEDWPQGARPLRRYLQALLDGTRAAIAAGTFLEEAKATVAADEREHWRLTERAHPLNVSRAFRELEWE